MGKYLSKKKYQEEYCWRNSLYPDYTSNLVIENNQIKLSDKIIPSSLRSYMKFPYIDDTNRVGIRDIEQMMRAAAVHDCPDQEISVPGVIHEYRSIELKYIIQQRFSENGVTYRGDANTHIIYFAPQDYFDPNKNIIDKDEDGFIDFDYSKDYIRYHRYQYSDSLKVYLSNENNFYWGKMYAISIHNNDIERCDGFEFKIQSIQDESMRNYYFNNAHIVNITRSENIEVVFHTGALGKIRVTETNKQYKTNDGMKINVYCKTDIGDVYFYSKNNTLGYVKNGVSINSFIVKEVIPNNGEFCIPESYTTFFSPNDPSTDVYVYNYTDAKSSGLFPNIDSMEAGKVYPI